MLNGIGYGRVSGKAGSVHSLAPAALGRKNVVALGVGPLII